MEANYMKDYVCCDIRLDSLHELLQHYEEVHAAQPNQTMGRTPRDQQHSSSPVPNAGSTHMQDIRSLDVRGHDAREALDESLDPRALRLSRFLAQRNSLPLSAGSGESQKAYDNFRTGVKRRAQSPIALEKVTSNERNDHPPVWNPSRIFQQWNTAFGTPTKTYFDTGERLQNSPLPTPAVFGKTHPALVDPFAHVKRWPREPNSHSELGQRPQSNSQFHLFAGAGYDGQVKSYSDIDISMWDEAFPTHARRQL